MVNYNNGKIYKIVDNTNGDIYIGSTTKSYLCQRLAIHVCKTKTKTNNCVSKHIIANGDYSIVLIELYPCNSKDELGARERYWIENTVCINRCIPTRTPKEYMETHREEAKARSKNYRETHKDRVLQQKTQRFNCECGSTYDYGHKQRHCKTEKHIAYINSLAI